MDAKQPSVETPPCPGCAERDRRNAALEARIEKLERIIDELRRGSKRQAAPFSRGAPKTKPNKPGRKKGDDYGTKACRAAPERIDEIHDAPLPGRCPSCGSRHVDHQRIEHQYQTEIPTRAIHRRFDVAVGHCAGCGHRVQGRHPLQTSDALGCCASQLGADAQALIVHLNKEAGLSHGKIARLFKTCFGITLSRGGACQAMLRAARRCEPAHDAIVARVRECAWAVLDETGWRIGGVSAWLHAAVTDEAVAYLIHRRRGFEATRELMGEAYAGLLIHDGWRPYERFWRAAHQTCLAHLLRRCRELLETATRGAVRFPRAVKTILQESLAVRDRRWRGLITPATAARKARELQRRMVTITEPIKTNAANERFAAHLFRQQRHLFTFLGREAIDATNWRAEQALRPAVVNRKVWGGNRTQAGAEAQSILMTVCQTARLQQLDPFHWLSRHLRCPNSAPSLIRSG